MEEFKKIDFFENDEDDLTLPFQVLDTFMDNQLSKKIFSIKKKKKKRKKMVKQGDSKRIRKFRKHPLAPK